MFDVESSSVEEDSTSVEVLSGRRLSLVFFVTLKKSKRRKYMWVFFYFFFYYYNEHNAIFILF